MGVKSPEKKRYVTLYSMSTPGRPRDEDQADVKAVVLKLGDGARDSADIIHIPVIKLSRANPMTGEGFDQPGSIPMTMGQEVVVEGPSERETFLGQSSREYALSNNLYYNSP